MQGTWRLSILHARNLRALSKSWLSHVTHMKESCHAYEWVMLHVNESCHTCEWVLSHIWMSHVTHMNESCHTYERVMSHIWMSHVTYVNESCHTCEWVMSHMWMNHVTHVNESWHIYKWVLSRMDESCHTYKWVLSYMNESCHLYAWVMSRVNKSCHMWHDSYFVAHANESCHTYERAMSHMWMSHVTHTNESCYICMNHVTYECMPHSYIHIRMSPVAYAWMSHVTHTNDFCHIYMYHVTHMHGSCHTYEWHMNEACLVAHTNESCRRSHDTCENSSQIWMRHICMNHVTYEWGMSCRTYEQNVEEVMTHMKIQVKYECVTYAWIMSHMNEACLVAHTNKMLKKSWHIWKFKSNMSCHIWMNHVTYEWGISCRPFICDMKSCICDKNHAWSPFICDICDFMSHINGLHVNLIFNIYDFMSHICDIKSCICDKNHAWFMHMWHMWLHVTYEWTSCQIWMVTYARIMSHEACLVAHTNKSCRRSHDTYEWSMSRMHAS